jgi:hypothetical protein
MSTMITAATAYQMRRSLKFIGLSSLLPVSILAEIPLACHRSVRAAPRLACWELVALAQVFYRKTRRDGTLRSAAGRVMLRRPISEPLQTIWMLPIYHGALPSWRRV